MSIQDHEDERRAELLEGEAAERELQEQHRRKNPAVWNKYWSQVRARIARTRDSGKVQE